MSINKTILTAAAVLAATSVVALQPKPAGAMPRINLDTQFMTTDTVQKVGVKKRRVKRFVRRHLRQHHRRHRHGRAHGYYRAYAGPACHAHSYKVPGIGLHTRFRCNHAHIRAYDSWYWK